MAEQQIGVTMPILNQPFTNFPRLARLADEAGFASVWDYEFFRNPFVIHGVCAPHTRLREYVQCLRATWKHLSDGQPFSFEGAHYRAASPMFNPWGVRPMVRDRIPIYLSVVRPRMLQLAGEVADGVLGYLATPGYLREVVQPNLQLGAARTGRDVTEIDRAALVLCSVSEDRQKAIRRARINVGNYICFPGADPMVQWAGIADVRDAVAAKLFTEGPTAFDLIPEDVVKMFAICGTPDEGREQLSEYDGLLDHVVLHTPYVPPLQQAESEDCFRQTISAFGNIM